eukprot:TRINITY_DN4119_c0_g1_i5.p1 TRINITY_DN4119_c0_g1~~TRINITY_DN4119_c0_g1_i5.p1  ORF type:complete len:263 (-),score=59.87 TRINITY_DN4119_c0_g1_i5:246-1034(-)
MESIFVEFNGNVLKVVEELLLDHEVHKLSWVTLKEKPSAIKQRRGNFQMTKNEPYKVGEHQRSVENTKNCDTVIAKNTTKRLHFPETSFTGTTSSEQEDFDMVYNSERKQAILAQKTRDRYFRQAANAYGNGNYVSANELAALGHKWNATTKELHAVAARRIFEFRNKNNGNCKIDLHGLHAREAVEYLVDSIYGLLADYQCSGGCELEVITGWGKGQEGYAILQPLMEDYLRCNHIPFQQPQPGKFMIPISKTIFTHWELD